ncbi:hypothetical protein TrispH2_001639 [Trichoplax sp. H2]|nr:hypothetical protein TrispH2_001639 [Trichoplax sp. H2]|eukprot:RDD46913.1 hypothetical protein TrispH2_001639 [Trichoplax sp. H2]
MADDEGSKLVTDEGSQQPDNEKQVNHDSGAGRKMRIFQLVSVIVATVMVLITLGLSIYRAVAIDGLYILLGINLLAVAQIGIVVFYWIRTEEIPASKSWFLYVVDLAVILECIFTNILLFRQ